MRNAFLRQSAGIFTAGMIIGVTAMLALPSPPPLPSTPAIETNACGLVRGARLDDDCWPSWEPQHRGFASAAVVAPALIAPTSPPIATPPAVEKPTEPGDGAEAFAAVEPSAASAQEEREAHEARRRAAKRRAERQRTREARAQAQRREWRSVITTRPGRPDSREYVPLLTY